MVLSYLQFSWPRWLHLSLAAFSCSLSPCFLNSPSTRSWSLALPGVPPAWLTSGLQETLMHLLPQQILGVQAVSNAAASPCFVNSCLASDFFRQGCSTSHCADTSFRGHRPGYSMGFLSGFVNCFKKAETCECFKKGRRMLMEGRTLRWKEGAKGRRGGRIGWEKMRSGDACPSDSGKKLEGQLGGIWWGRAVHTQWL